jgi:hypothetical protein
MASAWLSWMFSMTQIWSRSTRWVYVGGGAGGGDGAATGGVGHAGGAEAKTNDKGLGRNHISTSFVYCEREREGSKWRWK